MNVGVLLWNASPETGGRYTFEQEVLQGLLRLRDGCRHSFTVFVRGPAPRGLESTERVRIVALSRGRRVAEKLQSGASSIVERIGMRRRESHFGPFPLWLNKVLKKSGVDLMWYPTPGAATMDIPYITVVWDLQHRLQPFFPEVSGSREWAKRELQYATALRRAAYIVTGTQAGKAEIERFYQVSPERIRLLPHPTPRFAIDAPPDGDDQEILARLDLSRGFLFYPAQFWPHKNHVGLLAAVKVLKEHYGLTLPVVLVGADYGNEPFVRETARQLGIESQVRFLGFVSRRELVALYRGALAMTYVTYFGPENLPPLEAFALGCPVVASGVPGAEEQLGDAALLVDPAKPEEIADAVRRVHTDPALRQDLIKKGKVRAIRFTGNDFVMHTVQMLDEFEQIRNCWERAAA